MAPKRSHAPVFWLLFGAGGLLAALFGTALVFATGFAAPLGWPQGRLITDFGAMRAFARHPLGALLLWGVVSLFAWHAVHRILHSLHDLGLPGGRALPWLCYGAAAALTGVAAAALLVV